MLYCVMHDGVCIQSYIDGFPITRNSHVGTISPESLTVTRSESIPWVNLIGNLQDRVYRGADYAT